MADVFTNTYEPPSWLDKNIIQDALREGLGRESLNVTAVNIRPATNVGDNYLSQTFRASITVEGKSGDKEEDLSIIIKSMPAGSEVEKFVNEAKFFSREIQMLSNTLPLMQKILSQVDEQKIWADLYYYQEEPNNIIILEDLGQKGYKSQDRLKCLDLVHCLLVVESMAVFHAASLVALQEDTKLKEKYHNSYWQKNNEATVSNFIEEGFKNLLECLEKWKSFPPIYKEKLEKLKSSANEKLFAATGKYDDELNLINHGELWTSNLMFQYCNEIPFSCVFVDFQLSAYNSPMYDMMYFIFASPKNEVRLKHLDDILMAYYSKLMATCKKLNYPSNLSFIELKKMFLRRLFFGFFIVSALVPFMIVPSKDARDINDYLKAKDHNNQMIDNEFYKETVKSTLPFFLDHGILE